MFTEEHASQVLFTAAELGVHAFDFSWHPPLVRAVEQLKSALPEVTLFANLNWRCGITLGGTELLDLAAPVLATVQIHLSEHERQYVRKLPPDVRKERFGAGTATTTLTREDVASIQVNQSILRERLERVATAATYSLIGTDVVDWLVLLGRLDIVESLVGLSREYDLLPVSLTHWPTKTLQAFERVGCLGHWILLNPRASFFGKRSIAAMTRRLSAKPIYAFSVLRGARSLRAGISAAANFPGIYGLVVGLKSEMEVHETVPIAKEIWGRR